MNNIYRRRGNARVQYAKENEQTLEQKELQTRQSRKQEKLTPSTNEGRRKTLTPKAIRNLNTARKTGNAYFHAGCGYILNTDDFAEF